MFAQLALSVALILPVTDACNAVYKLDDGTEFPISPTNYCMFRLDSRSTWSSAIYECDDGSAVKHEYSTNDCSGDSLVSSETLNSNYTCKTGGEICPSIAEVKANCYSGDKYGQPHLEQWFFVTNECVSAPDGEHSYMTTCSNDSIALTWYDADTYEDEKPCTGPVAISYPLIEKGRDCAYFTCNFIPPAPETTSPTESASTPSPTGPASTPSPIVPAAVTGMGWLGCGFTGFASTTTGPVYDYELGTRTEFFVLITDDSSEGPTAALTVTVNNPWDIYPFSPDDFYPANSLICYSVGDDDGQCIHQQVDGYGFLYLSMKAKAGDKIGCIVTGDDQNQSGNNTEIAVKVMCVPEEDAFVAVAHDEQQASGYAAQSAEDEQAVDWTLAAVLTASAAAAAAVCALVFCEVRNRNRKKAVQDLDQVIEEADEAEEQETASKSAATTSE